MKNIFLMALAVFQLAFPALGKEYKVAPEPRTFATGRLNVPTDALKPVSKEFLQAPFSPSKDFDLRVLFNFVPIKDQGQCGSCVYFAGTACFEDEQIIGGNLGLPTLSPQFIMDRAQWSCSGSLAEYFGNAVVKYKGIASLQEYPYRMADQSPRPYTNVYGKIDGYVEIDHSDLSVMAALSQYHPVMSTIAATSAFMQYDGGVYDTCNSMDTNHQVVTYGWSCGKDECRVDANGKVLNPDAYWIGRNSWGQRYGEKGWFKILMHDSRGNRCLNYLNEAGYFKTGLTPQVPMDGGYTEYGPYGECKDGKQTRTRTCNNPAPANGGKPCVGPAEETQACVVPPSPLGGLPVWVFVAFGLLVLVIAVLVTRLLSKKGS
jgi:hypothetical protein